MDPRYGSFLVEVYLSDQQNTSQLEQPPHKSWVLDDYLEAEQFRTGEMAGLPPSYKLRDTADEVSQLFKHEMDHYRIGRLIALDLYRTLCEHADTFARTDAADVQANFEKYREDYRTVREVIQYAYDVATLGGSDAAVQRH